jgi:hypothetical protein
MLYDFDLSISVANQWVLIRDGAYPLYGVHLRITDLLQGTATVYADTIPEINAPAIYRPVSWRLNYEHHYRVFFEARNGAWRQDLHLVRSDLDHCWLAATRVFASDLSERFSHVDEGFERVREPFWKSS